MPNSRLDERGQACPAKPLSEPPYSELLPASVRSVLQRPGEPSLALRQAFEKDVNALLFRRLRIAGVAYASVHTLSAVLLLFSNPAAFRAHAGMQALPITLSLLFAALSYAPKLERRAFALSVALTLGTALYVLEPILRYGLRWADHGTLVLLIVCTGLLFPYTLGRMLGTASAVFGLYLAAALLHFRVEDRSILIEGVFFLSSASTIATVGARLAHQLREREFSTRWALNHERDAAEQLLCSILPASIVKRLKRDQSAIAEAFMEATVMFVDIVGFTPLSARMPPGKLVEMLNQVFSKFDALTERHGLEKIKTIGDAYMVVGGVPTPRKDHAVAMATLALEMRDVTGSLHTPTGEPLQIRIGLNCGPVVAGVIGTTKFSYDLWGDTVNTAARMEAHAEPGTIQVTERAFERLRTQFHLEPRGSIDVKGKGPMKTYVLVGPRLSLRPPARA